jgi:5-formyltetrahydrofolate cyclo-ligase
MDQGKLLLRQTLLRKMKSLSQDEVERASGTACERALQSYDWSTVRTMLAYMPIEGSGEIDPRYLVEKLTQVRVDYVQPSKDAVLPTDRYDVVLVPVVGFNEERYRIGRGGGWYDRLLAMHPEASAIGLAYPWSKMVFVPESHDKPLAHIYAA